MTILKFRGYSNNMFKEYGITNTEIYNDYNSNTPIQCLISSSEGELMIVGHYNIHPTDKCWTIGIAQSKEGMLIPNWKIKYKVEHCGYSPVLEVEVPVDFILTWYNDGKLT